MNYFEFYGIPEAFHVDQALVKRKFYELSKQFHPDFYINEPDEKQQEILELSTVNNKAYQVLSNRNRLAEYILGLHNLVNEGDKYQLPQDFLMDMMDINEALMELEFDANADELVRITAEVNTIEDSLNNELEERCEAFDSAPADQKESILLIIKDLWYRKKYLLRIRESLNKFRPL